MSQFSQVPNKQNLFYLLLHQGLQNLPCPLLNLSYPSHPVFHDHPVTKGEYIISHRQINHILAKCLKATFKILTLAPGKPSP